jgi:hypothetical protein
MIIEEVESACSDPFERSYRLLEIAQRFEEEARRLRAGDAKEPKTKD